MEEGKLNKIKWKISPQRLDCTICGHHQAMYETKIKARLPGKPMKISLNPVVCSVCAKLPEHVIAKKTLQGLGINLSERENKDTVAL